jgi:hypothetical protein
MKQKLKYLSTWLSEENLKQDQVQGKAAEGTLLLHRLVFQGYHQEGSK